MPVWAPSVGEEAGFALVSAARTMKAGLETRPMADTLRWYLQRPEEERQKLKAGLSPERESTLLAAREACGSTAAC
jgi:2'-hydroxyisoflavone reductase